jgi:hypothetical protein
MSYKPSLEQKNLVLKLHKQCGYNSTQYLISDKMEVYFNVLGPLIEHKVGGTVKINLLSHDSGIGVGVGNPISLRKCCNQVSSLAV